METVPQIKLKKEKSDFKKVKINSSETAYNYMKSFYFDDMELFESSFMLLLSNSNMVIGWVKLSQGGTCGTVIDPVLVAKYAIESLAKCVIIGHNHPSGNHQPSEADTALTRKVKDGLKLFDIRLLDHIILANESYFSYEDNGLL